MKRVLITGEQSYVGTHVEQWLLNTPDCFTVKTISVRDDCWKNEDFTKYDVVYHVAGIAHVNAKKSMEPLYRRVNTDLTIEVAKWAKQHGVKQFVYMSSAIVYHESQSLKADVITRDTKPAPNTFYGDSKLRAELGLKELEEECFKIVILRCPMIYGPGARGNFLRLAKLATITPIFPDYHNKRSMLYIDNLCEFVKQVITRELSGIFHPDNKDLADTVEIVSAFAELNNHRIHFCKWLNVFVYLGSPFINAINKMFADYYFAEDVKAVGFDYEVVSLKNSFSLISVADASLGLR